MPNAAKPAITDANPGQLNTSSPRVRRAGRPPEDIDHAPASIAPFKPSRNQSVDGHDHTEDRSERVRCVDAADRALADAAASSRCVINGNVHPREERGRQHHGQRRSSARDVEQV